MGTTKWIYCLMIGMCPLSSGSEGNLVFVASKNTKLLFDVGLSYKKILEKLAEIDLTIDDIDAIVISHEHSDHIKGLEQIAKHTAIPILCCPFKREYKLKKY